MVKMHMKQNINFELTKKESTGLKCFNGSKVFNET